MKKTLITLTAAAVLSASTLSAATASQKTTKTFDVRSGSSITLTTENGLVTVKTWDQPQVKVEAQKVVEARENTKAFELLPKVEVKFNETESGLAIESIAPTTDEGAKGWLANTNAKAKVNYEIYVPRDTEVTINGKTFRSGDSAVKVQTTKGSAALAKRNA